MNLRVSFLICQNSNDNEPYIFFSKNENNNYELPTFQMEDNEYDVDNFVYKSFKSITNVEPIKKDGTGWINIFLTNTIIHNEKYSFVYMCKLPNDIKINNFKKIKMSSILQSNEFEENYISQVIDCFNNLYLR